MNVPPTPLGQFLREWLQKLAEDIRVTFSQALARDIRSALTITPTTPNRIRSKIIFDRVASDVNILWDSHQSRNGYHPPR